MFSGLRFSDLRSSGGQRHRFVFDHLKPMSNNELLINITFLTFYLTDGTKLWKPTYKRGKFCVFGVGLDRNLQQTPYLTLALNDNLYTFHVFRENEWSSAWHSKNIKNIKSSEKSQARLCLNFITWTHTHTHVSVWTSPEVSSRTAFMIPAAALGTNLQSTCETR